MLLQSYFFKDDKGTRRQHSNPNLNGASTAAGQWHPHLVLSKMMPPWHKAFIFKHLAWPHFWQGQSNKAAKTDKGLFACQSRSCSHPQEIWVDVAVSQFPVLLWGSSCAAAPVLGMGPDTIPADSSPLSSHFLCCWRSLESHVFSKNPWMAFRPPFDAIWQNFYPRIGGGVSP